MLCVKSVEAREETGTPKVITIGFHVSDFDMLKDEHTACNKLKLKLFFLRQTQDWKLDIPRSEKHSACERKARMLVHCHD